MEIAGRQRLPCGRLLAVQRAVRRVDWWLFLW